MTTHKGGFIKNSTQIDDAVTMDIAIAVRSNASASTFIIASCRVRINDQSERGVIHHANARILALRSSSRVHATIFRALYRVCVSELID